MGRVDSDGSDSEDKEMDGEDGQIDDEKRWKREMRSDHKMNR
jgi:hypothetical protein